MAASAGDRAFFLRVGVRDADAAVRELERFGSAGVAAGRKIVNASTPASRSLVALSTAAGEVRGRLDGLVASTGSVGRVLGALGPAGLAAAAGVGAAAVAARQMVAAVRDADEIAKFSAKIGVASDALQELRFAAERSGVSSQNLDTALQRLTRRAAEAASGTGELLGVVKQYGIQVTDQNGQVRKTVDLFGDLADVISGTTDEAEALRVATKAFDTEGAGLVNLLRQGRDGVEALRERARELGLVLDQDLLAGAERTSDALDTFGEVIRLNVNRALLEMAPAAATAAEKLADLFAWARRFGLAENDAAAGIYRAINPEFPQLEGLDQAALEKRLAVQEKALAAIRSTPEAFARVAAATGRQVAEVEADLVKELGEIRRRLGTAAAEVFDWADFLPTGGGKGASVASKAAAKALADLKAAIDPIAKIEQERAERLAELDKVTSELNLTDAERLKLQKQINDAADAAIKSAKEQTEAGRKAAETAREQARRDAELVREKDQVREAIDRLDASYSAVDRAAKEYTDTLETLARAADLGILTEEELADRVERAALAWERADAAARGYAGAVTTASAASNRATAIAGATGALDFSGTFRQAAGQLYGNVTSGGGLGLSDVSSFVLNTIANKAGNYVLDGLFSGDSLSSILSNGFSSIAQSVSGIGAGIEGAIGSAIASFLPAQSAAAGGALFGAEAGIAIQPALSSAGGLSLIGGSAALPGIGLALAGVALILSQVLGPKKSSGPALGATFGVGDGTIDTTRVGADNGADVEGAQSLADAVQTFTNAFLDLTGSRLLPGAFAGELGFESGRYATAISSPGLTDGDKRKGRSPDLRTFGSGDGAAERATADFITRSFLDALDRGLIEGLSDETEAVIRSVLTRLDANGGAATLEEAGQALDFATSFEDTIARMNAAGDAAALQLLDVADAAEQYAEKQGASLRAFADNLDTFFGEVQREPDGVRVDGIDAGGRVGVSQFDGVFGGDNNDRVGFRFNGGVYYQQTQDDGSIAFRDAVTGKVVPAIRDATGELLVMADAIGAIASDAPMVTDAGDPARLAAGEAALDHFVDVMLGIADDADTEPLTGYALALKQGQANLEEFRDVLTDIGYTAEEADAKLTAANAALADRVREDFDQSIQDQILAIRSPGAAALTLLSDNFDRLMREATAVGGDTEAVRDLYRRQVEAQVRQEEVAAIQEGLQARNAEISTLEQSTSKLSGLVQSIASTRASLLRNSALSPLSPREELAAALDQFRKERDAGLAGDQDAAARANALATEVLQLARGVEASGPEYARIFAEVDGGLAALEGKFTTDLEVSRRQLTELEGIRDALDRQLQVLTDQASAGSSADRDFGSKSTRNRALAALFPEFAGDFGSGGFSAFYSGLSADDPRRSTAENIISSIGYADGGDHPGGLRIVGERGPEIEVTGPSRIFNARQTAEILSQASAASSAAGGRVEALLARLVSAVDDQARAFEGLARQVLQLASARPTGRLGFGRL